MNSWLFLLEVSYRPIVYCCAFVLAFCLCLRLTPIVRRAAIHYDIVDRPDGRLKQHTQPVAYLGGLSIYLSFLFTLAITFEFTREVLGLLLAGTIIAMLGVVDDLRQLSPRLKLAGQALAVFVLVKSGIYIKIVFLPYAACLLLTFFWLIIITNAFNIIDVMDGLSTGVGLIISSVLFVVALLNNRPMIALLTIALAGTLLGFLRYNFAPATMYLGDMGSMFIGLMLGALSMIGSYTGSNNLGWVAPLIILGVPLFDTLFVMYIRWRRGMPVIYGSPDHFALRLRRWKLSTRQTVLISYSASLMLGLLGLGIMLSPSPGVCLGIIAVVMLAGLVLGYLLKKIDMRM